jgi:hypothetical protein
MFITSRRDDVRLLSIRIMGWGVERETTFTPIGENEAAVGAT